LASALIKRSGNEEKYDVRKLYSSIYMSLLLNCSQQKEAELVAGEVSKLATRHVLAASVCTTHELRVFSAKQLDSYNNSAAYIYTQHRALS
jgi:hypothetical protein